MAKKQASLTKSLTALLSLKPSIESRQKLAAMGLPKSKINNCAVIMAALIEKASKGEVSAIKEVLNITAQISNDGDENVSKLYEALSDNDNA